MYILLMDCESLTQRPGKNKYAGKKSKSLLDVEDTFFHITDMILEASW